MLLCWRVISSFEFKGTEFVRIFLTLVYCTSSHFNRKKCLFKLMSRNPTTVGLLHLPQVSACEYAASDRTANYRLFQNVSSPLTIRLRDKGLSTSQKSFCPCNVFHFLFSHRIRGYLLNLLLFIYIFGRILIPLSGKFSYFQLFN